MLFSVCVLLYGDYPQLAKRVLGSIAASRPPAEALADIRMGLNDVSAATRAYVHDFCQVELSHAPIRLYDPPRNVGKYPLMRRMFYDSSCALAKYVMWFDDDSYLQMVKPDWWYGVQRQMRQVTVLGEIYAIRQRGNQYVAIRQQPWYAGKDVKPSHRFRFATGGWWVARTDFLQRWDYPFPEIYHNGGDSILGELLRQQGAVLKGGSQGVVINEGGRGSRRGIGLAEEVYVWQNWDLSKPDLSHHAFECQVHTYPACNTTSDGST